MNKIISILVVISICLAIVKAFSPGFAGKFCDQNLPDTKIAQFEACQQFVPSEIFKVIEQCLQKMNKSVTFKDFRTVACDPSQRKTLFECAIQNKKSEQKPDFTKHKECMDKAMNN